MEIYFTRHGKTKWNLERRFQGMTGDSPLLDTSLQEIKFLGDYLKDIPFEKIYSSTSARAKKTAEGIKKQLKNEIEIGYNENLRELGLGDLEGQFIDDMAEKYPVELKNLRNHLDQYDPQAFGGEPIEDAIARIQGVVTTAIKNHQGPLLFVGHGASLTAAIQWLSGKSLAELRKQGGLVNNSISILETDDTKELPYRLTCWNDASFLADQESLDALL